MSPIFLVPILGFPVVQDSGERPKHPGGKPSPVALKDVRPVTAHEARSSFSKCYVLLQKVTGATIGTPSMADAARPATREEIVGEMARVYDVLQPSYKFTPAAVPHDPRVFKIGAAQRTNLEKLVTRGCIARVGPLAVGPTPGLTVKEFGDALGFFLARVTNMTHLPDPKWTPRIRDDN